MHKKDRNIILIIAVGFLLLTGPTGLSQVVDGQPSSASGRMIFTHWALEDASGKTEIDQFAIPLTGLIPIRDNLEMRFYTATSWNDLNAAANEYSLSGLSDLRIQFNQSLSNDQILLGAGVNIPSGKTKLNVTDEWPIIDYLSQNFVSFPLRRLGEGPGFNLLAGAASSAGSIRYGATAMFQFFGKYEAYENGGDYDPGELLSFSLNADWQHPKGMVGINLIYDNYSADKLDEKMIFNQGNQFEIRLSGARRFSTTDINVFLQYINRGRNTRYDSAQAIYDQLKIFGNEFGAFVSAAAPLNQTLTLTPAIEYRLIGANEYDFEKSYLLGFGMEVSYLFSPMLDAGIGFKYYTGKANDSAIDLSGYQFSAGLTAAF